MLTTGLRCLTKAALIWQQRLPPSVAAIKLQALILPDFSSELTPPAKRLTESHNFTAVVI